jgi:putative spermidine/putrescine transport system ATP-binding protein/spermidine/putrescine transport system ATP-binding protein
MQSIDNHSTRADGVDDIHLASVRKSYGAVKAVRDVDLAIGRGKFFSLLGPSGCGKTTTLRLIAGFESPTSGNVWINGKDVTAEPAYRRDFAMVFQNLALFPHLSVAENVAFGLKMRHVPRSERGVRVQQALDQVKLSGFGDRRIRQLSGGQQQRVALARAIVVKPAVLLLDEPLSALDKNLREDMQIELRQLQRNLGITTVFVTHDQEEALTLSDEIAVMNNGLVEQRGAPKELYTRPATRFIASFLGTSNFLAGKVVGRDGADAIVEVPDHRFPVLSDAGVGTNVELAIRPESIGMRDRTVEGGLAATIREIVYRGATTFFFLDSPAGALIVHAQNADRRSAGWSVGDGVKCAWSAESAVVLKNE